LFPKFPGGKIFGYIFGVLLLFYLGVMKLARWLYVGEVRDVEVGWCKIGRKEEDALDVVFSLID
jgi:hypothetical protein